MRAALAFAVLIAGCSRTPCQLDVRVAGSAPVDAAELARAVDALRIRLEPWAQDFRPQVRAQGERELVIELASEPGEQDLDSLRSLVARVPTFAVHVRVDDASWGAGLDREVERLAAWSSAHAALPLEQFNRTPRDAGGPAAELAWVAVSQESYSKTLPLVGRSWPCAAPSVPPASSLAAITAADLARVEPITIEARTLAIELVWKPQAAQLLADVATSYGDRTLCWTLDGEIVSVQRADATRGGCRISPIQRDDHRERLMRALRSAMAAGANAPQLEVVGLRKTR